MSKFKWTKEQLIQAVKNNLSIAGVCRELNLRPVGGNYKTIHYYIKEYNLDTSHFTGQGWNVGTRYKNIRTKRPIEDILSGKVECRKIKEALTDNADGNLEPSLIQEGAETRHDKPKSKSKSKKEPKFCQYCGKQLDKRTYKYCSKECYHKANGSKRPPVYELLSKFKELKSYVQVGKYYGVTDNAVKKWVILYQIEDMVKEQSRPQT